MGIDAWDGDGHVEEWEETFSDRYLEPAFRDRRPTVHETGEFEHDYIWEIDGKRLRIGGSPSSKDGVVSTEYELMSKWRGPHESGEFHSAEDRLAVMEAEDTFLSVNYPTLLLRWPIAGDPALNQALTRSYNSWVADISNQSPERLKWVTVIDASDPKEIVREMERTKEMGSVGVMVLGDYGSRGLDHPDFEPMWATANENGMSINVHPGMGALEANKTYPNIAGDQFMMSVIRGFKAITSSGVLDRYPDVKVSFLETGCTWVDFAISAMNFSLDNLKDRMRIGTVRKEHQEVIERGLPEATPEEYIAAGRIFIGFEVDDDLLPYMVDKYGTDCWVYASDFPHAHRVPDSPKYLMDRDDISDDVKARIFYEGTARLYGMESPLTAGSQQ
jgi:predicted TIM-barrel fold metal-dependent hydrolase